MTIGRIRTPDAYGLNNVFTARYGECRWFKCYPSLALRIGALGSFRYSIAAYAFRRAIVLRWSRR